MRLFCLVHLTFTLFAVLLSTQSTPQNKGQLLEVLVEVLQLSQPECVTRQSPFRCPLFEPGRDFTLYRCPLAPFHNPHGSATFLEQLRAEVRIEYVCTRCANRSCYLRFPCRFKEIGIPNIGRPSKTTDTIWVDAHLLKREGCFWEVKDHRPRIART